MENVYKIKKAHKIPLTLAVLASLPVFTDVLMSDYETGILILIGILILLFYVLTLNNLLRKVTINKDQITVRSLGGTSKVDIEDITSVDGVTMGSRQFITISAGKKNHLITNSYAEFSNLVDDIEQLSLGDRQGEGIRMLKENPVTRTSDITTSWITVILLTLILVLRYFPH